MTIAHKLTDETAHQSYGALVSGRVLLKHENKLSVSLDDGEVLAKRAASCLLSPQPGDRVLLSMVPEPFILAVLESEHAAEVVFEGDVTLKAAGRLDLRGAVVGMVSRSLEVKADEAQLFVRRIDAFAKTAKTHFDKLGAFAKTYERAADTVIERAKRAYRFVEEYDQVRARHIDYRAEQTTQIKGETTVVTARQVIKVDGESVHIG